MKETENMRGIKIWRRGMKSRLTEAKQTIWQQTDSKYKLIRHKWNHWGRKELWHRQATDGNNRRRRRQEVNAQVTHEEEQWLKIKWEVETRKTRRQRKETQNEETPETQKCMNTRNNVNKYKQRLQRPDIESLKTNKGLSFERLERSFSDWEKRGKKVFWRLLDADSVLIFLMLTGYDFSISYYQSLDMKEEPSSTALCPPCFHYLLYVFLSAFDY